MLKCHECCLRGLASKCVYTSTCCAKKQKKTNHVYMCVELWSQSISTCYVRAFITENKKMPLTLLKFHNKNKTKALNSLEEQKKTQQYDKRETKSIDKVDWMEKNTYTEK